MTRTHRALVAVGTVVFVAASAVAEAQPQPAPPQATPLPQPGSPQTPTPQAQRPFTGLFRGVPATPHDTVSLQLSSYGGFDDDGSADSADGTSSGLAGDGPYAGVDADLTFAPTRRGKVSFDARGATSLRYYGDLGEFQAASQTGSAGVSINLSRRVMLETRGGVAYTPYFDFTTLPGMEEPIVGPEIPPRIPDNTLTTRRVLTYDGGVDLTHTKSERTSFLFRYAARATELLDEGQSSVDHTASAGFNRRLDRRTVTRVAYVHRQGQSQAGLNDRPVRVDDIEFGYDRDWARSPTRRTVFSLTAGPSLIVQSGQRYYRGFGSVSIAHPFSRSWNVRALYRRGVQFVDGDQKPYFSDSMTFALSGLLTRRFDVSMSAGAVLGDLGLEGSTTPYDTYSASSRFRYAMNRKLAFYGEYLYNHSIYSETATLPSLSRTSLRFGLTLYVPLQQERARAGQ